MNSVSSSDYDCSICLEKINEQDLTDDIRKLSQDEKIEFSKLKEKFFESKEITKATREEFAQSKEFKSLTPLNQDVVSVNCCGNLFHDSCLKSWLERKNICPLCREIISTSKTSNQQNDQDFLPSLTPQLITVDERDYDFLFLLTTRSLHYVSD